jgi:glycosyltransferase involved in cell wall biosynthesis
MTPKVIAILAATSGGGTVTSLRGLLHLWHKANYSVTLVRTPDSPGLLREERLLGIDVVEIPRRDTRATLGSALALLRDVLRLWHDIRRIRKTVRSRPGAVVLPFLTGTALVTLAATIGLPNRVIVCERNDTSMQPFGWHVRLLRRLLYPRAAAITVNSTNPAASDLLRKISRGRPVHVVPNPHPRDMQPADPVNSRVILAVGRLVKQKQHAALIEAFAKIAGRLPEWHVVIVGEGPLRGDLESQIDHLSLTHRVTLAGQVEDPRPFYATAGLFVLPSDYEGTSNALLEAASAGLPCIVSEETAPPQTACILLSVPAGSPNELAVRMLEACTNSDRRAELGRAAKRWVNHLSDDDVVAEWISVIRSASTLRAPAT